MKRTAISLAPVSILAAATVTEMHGFANAPGKASAAPAVPVPPPAPVPPAAPAASTENSAKPEKVIFGITTNVAMPANVKAGKRSKYPFDSLPAPVAGQNPPSFGIAHMTAKNMTSVIHNANKNAREIVKDEAGNVVYETTDLKDAQGAVIGQTAKQDDNGKPIAKTRQIKEFRAVDVDPKTDPEGASVRVFRTL